jgi:hypothetical protein
MAIHNILLRASLYSIDPKQALKKAHNHAEKVKALKVIWNLLRHSDVLPPEEKGKDC